MNNIERIFEAVCNILSVYVSFKVTDVFLEKKRKLPRMANIVYVLVWLINTVVAFGFRNVHGDYGEYGTASLGGRRYIV